MLIVYLQVVTQRKKKNITKYPGLNTVAMYMNKQGIVKSIFKELYI